MDYLWTPWRYQYISNAAQGEEACVFCYAFGADRDPELLVLHRGRVCAVILNRFPYTTGHLMIAPYRHVALLEDGSPEELGELAELSARCQRAMRHAYRPDGFNLGMNLGRCAGAGVVGHFHMHVVARWSGDGNFMSVVGETRVLPEELSTSYQKLQQFF
jgi:ATP adenylyltransferase